MNPSNPHKQAIFNDLRKELEPYSAFSDKELDTYIFRNPQTLRLRKEGYELLSKVYWSEKFDVSKTKLTGREILTLKNEVPLPYFLTAKYLYLFSSKQAFILSLLKGDVHKWLEKLHKNSRK
jgi:hypothetical protein